MKTRFRILVATLLAFVCTTGTWAQTITLSGVTYDVSSGSTAFVTAISSDTNGNIAFPEMVTYANPNTGLTTTCLVGGFASTATPTSLNVSKWKSLYLPPYFTQLGSGLTSRLTNLESVQFAQYNQLNSLPSNAFSYCDKLKTVVLGNYLTTIGTYSFRGCSSLTTISSANSLANITSIGERAFQDCSSLQGISFPGVKSVGNGAFNSCTSLTTVSLPNATYIGESAFSSCENLTTIDMSKAEEIRNSAFHACYGLQQVNLPKAVTISNGAFRDCESLQSVTTNCYYIKNSAFHNCTSLNNVQLGTQLREIGEAAFYDCSGLTSITLPGSLNYIGFNAFRNTQIKTIEIPSGIVPVSNNFYTNASEVTVKVAAGNASIYKQLHGWNESAFTFVEEGQKGISFRADARVKDIELWSGGVKIRTISPAAASFSQTVNMPTDLELRIPVRYFSRILINGSSQPSYYTTSTPTDEAYSGYRFYTLPDLTYVSSIEVQFNYAPEHGIHFADATVKAICVENWDTNGDGELSVAEAAAVTTLRKDNGDGTYGNSVFRTKEITSFDELKYFTGLTSLDENCFYGCYKMKSIIVPDNVETIGDYAFYTCQALQMIPLPDKLKTIGESAFYGCSALESIIIPRNVETIGQYAFLNTSNLISVAVNEANPYLDSRGGCNAVIESATNKLLVGCKNTRIPDDVTAIGFAVFQNSTLQSVELPAGLTSIGDYAFYYCGSLSSIIARMDVPARYESHTFLDVNSTYKLFVPEGKKQAYIDAGWTERVFKGGIYEIPEYDANGDGQTTIVDVTRLVDKIVGR